MTFVGILLLVVTVAAAVLIGRKANESVRNFDEAKHESYLGGQNERK
jgi:hypothetical protein